MAEARINDRCDLCEAEDNVDHFCVNCDEILCSNCKACHQKSRKSRDDKIISLSQARRDNIVHNSTAVFCSVHSTEEVTLLCVTCDKLICAECLVEEHKTHETAMLDETRDSKTKELDKVMETMKQKQFAYENVLDIGNEVHSRFSKSIDQVRKEIADQKRKILEELNSVCDEQLTELSILQENEDNRYFDACNKLQAQNHAMTSAIQTAKNSLASNNTVLIIKSSTDTTNALQTLEEPTLPNTMTATYEPGDRSHQTICQVQGEINIEEGDIPELMTDVNKEI